MESCFGHPLSAGAVLRLTALRDGDLRSCADCKVTTQGEVAAHKQPGSMKSSDEGRFEVRVKGAHDNAVPISGLGRAEGQQSG
jgi:hypothetical protein